MMANETAGGQNMEMEEGSSEEWSKASMLCDLC